MSQFRFTSDSFLKFDSALLQQFYDGKMLRTDALALSAGYTVACLPFVLRHDGVLTQGPELGAAFLAVLHVEDLRDRNPHGTFTGMIKQAISISRWEMVHLRHQAAPFIITDTIDPYY